MKTDRKGSFTFPGGVHPSDKKNLTADSKIQYGFTGKESAIMLCQHIGAVCQPLVSKSDEVEEGQKIGENEAFVSAPVHCPIKGKVKGIELRPHAVLGRSEAIIIEGDSEERARRPSEGEDVFGSAFDESQYTSEQICQAIREAGIVGMGGAGFPTAVKIGINAKQPKEVLIVNGCECEPYITCDYRIMLEWTYKILAGVRLAQKVSGCSKVLIAIEDNKPEAIEAMSEAISKLSMDGKIGIAAVKTKYPQGGERQLIKSVLKRNVPTGGIPPMIGVLVLNVATTAAIAEAVVEGTALTHRVVTVTGEGIKEPSNYYAAIGTSVEELIDFSGGLTEEAVEVILGGPMMGISIADLSTPITKTTGAITVLTREQIGEAKFSGRQTACIRCGRCLLACPENLNPTKIAHAVKNNMLDLAKKYYISGCMECGACSYVCPANIELTGYIKTGKILIAKEKKTNAE